MNPLAKEPASESGRPHRIILADDSAANRKLYSTVLKASGFEVLLAEDGGQVMELLEEYPPDLLILDYMMPIYDGAEVVRRVRKQERYAEVPALILTASEEPMHLELAMESGATDYLTKPANLRVLGKRSLQLASAFRRRQAEQTRHESERKIWLKEQEQLRSEMDSAREVQKGQLPNVPVLCRNARISGALVPCGAVGGDLFEAKVTVRGRVFFALIDVSGHGTASALLAGEVKARLSSLVERCSLADAMKTVNNDIAARQGGKYTCVAAGELKGDRLRIINSGLPPVAVIRDGEIVMEIAGGGLPLGLFPDSEYEVAEIEVTQGDRIIMLTDGATEPWGPADDVQGAASRLGLWRCRWGEEDNIESRLETAVRDLDHELRDDTTALLVDIAYQQTASLRAETAEVRTAMDWALEVKPSWMHEDILHFAFAEAVTNAIVHGCLGVESDHRRDSMGQYFTEMVEAEPQSVRCGVKLSYWESEGFCAFGLKWNGVGCPPDKRTPPETIDFMGASAGAGLTIIHDFFDRVEWTEDGREMVLYAHDKSNEPNESEGEK